MEKQKTIKVLLDLISYIEDEWDWEDEQIIREAERDIEAINSAIEIIKCSNIVGRLELNNEKYIISK